MLIARLLRKLLCYWIKLYSFAGIFHRNKIIYLTFDDGPDPINSNKIMDILSQYDIKATFFLVGTQIDKHVETARRMVREGHVLGNHTNSHKVFPYIPREERIKDIEYCQKKIESLQNSKIRIFRPPQGLINFSDLLYLLHEKYMVMLWSLDSNDHQLSGNIEYSLMNLSKSHYVILFHDDNAFCIDALTNLLPVWIKQGFQFAVPERRV